MEPEEGIIATRQRRVNAGNRLRALLDAQETLDDDDEHNIFMEFDDDQEFELGADSQGAQGMEGGDDEEDDDEDDDDVHTDSPAPKRRKTSTEAEADSDDDADAEEAQGSDFFSESESSSENDSEPEDAGEKELQRKEKEEKTRKRLAARKTYEIPTAEKLAKPRVTAQAARAKAAAKAARKPVKRKSTTVEELINSDRRTSRRATAVKNTQEVLERLKEQEEKRAAYVPREKKVIKKLTQEERLAEAKITEQQNIDSLHNFFKQEDLRKQRQREAMLAKRIPLKSFIRFVSSSKLVDVVPLPSVEEVEVKPVAVKEEPVATIPETIGAPSDLATPTAVPDTVVPDETSVNGASERAAADPATEQPVDSGVAVGAEDVEMAEAEAQAEDSAKTEPELVEVDGQTEKPGSEAPAKDDTPMDTDGKPETPAIDASEEPEAEDDEEANSDRDSATHAPTPAPSKPKKAEVIVEGPKDKVGTSVVQLLEFAQDRSLSRPEIKRYLLGPQAVVPSGRDYSINNCVVTGKPARFRDSKSKGLYYASLEAFKVIETVREGGYNWNWGLGGVFTEHEGGKCVKRVPEGYFVKKEEDSKEKEMKNGDDQDLVEKTDDVNEGDVAKKDDVKEGDAEKKDDDKNAELTEKVKTEELEGTNKGETSETVTISETATPDLPTEAATTIT